MEHFFFDLSLILVGSALLAVLAIYFKQPIILAYILCGILVGPSVLGFVQDVHLVENISHLGITLLLFLAGLTLHPQKLLKVFRNASIVTAANSLFSFGVGFFTPYFFGFPKMDCFIIAMAMMFSSTILVVKLLPTTELHHRRMGAVCIGILILQDLLAVAVLAFIRCLGTPDNAIVEFLILSAKLVAFIVILVVLEYYLLRRVMEKVDQFHEALFILGLAWCFGVASISHNMGLFHETGAFFSGVVLARHKISRFISEELKPLRDFFLVLFFFTLGARISLVEIKNMYLIIILMAAIFTFLRPWIFQKAFILSKERKPFAKEAGVRMGQLSEFGLLVGILALEESLITNQAAQLIQIVTILTFIVSSYRVFSRYPTPIGVSSKLMQN